MSLRRSVRTVKCPYDEISYDELSYSENSYGEKSGHASFFVPNNPQSNLYKYDLRTIYSYCSTGQNLYKNDLAAEPKQI